MFLVYVFDGAAPPVVAYSDSSHMDCVDSSRSTLAYLFFFYGQVVTWYSKLHTFVTTCSNHSEYAAMFQAAKEAQSIYNWLIPLLSVLGAAVIPVPIFNDNDGASALALDPVGRFKNKHVRMEHHYTQELVSANVIVPVRVSTEENRSDLLTKALGPTAFPKFARSLVGPIAAPPEHRVLMFRVVAKEGNHHVTSEGDIIRNASACALEFSEVICSVAQVLALQQKRMTDAATVLHNRLETLLQHSSSVSSSYPLPGPHSANVVDEAKLPAPESDEVGFILGEFEDQNGVRSPVIAPDPRGFENHEVELSDPEPNGVEEQVEYFQNPIARDGVEGQAEYFRDLIASGGLLDQVWVKPTAPLSPSCRVGRSDAPLPPPCPIADPHAVHAVPAVHAVAARCTYCRKSGHSVEGCKRRHNDRSYLQPPKRKRR